MLKNFQTSDIIKKKLFFKSERRSADWGDGTDFPAPIWFILRTRMPWIQRKKIFLIFRLAIRKPCKSYLVERQADVSDPPYLQLRKFVLSFSVHQRLRCYVQFFSLFVSLNQKFRCHQMSDPLLNVPWFARSSQIARRHQHRTQKFTMFF